MSGPRSLSHLLSGIAGKALDRKALGLGQLLTQWAEIVGPELAPVTLPIKLTKPKGNDQTISLSIATSSSHALALQHESPLLLERINGFFGYKAVGQIKLVHQHRPSRPQEPKRQRLLPDEQIESMVANIEDPLLKIALSRLGQSMEK